ncbi:hypothetical protein NIES4102_36030 [Chondrocystis sp. NIES-4102]|nr:hypothetical protein NIES4102_36030 [Chondrocystis sp. NIES-4102]
MTENLPTRGQVERDLSQKIQAFYRNYLKHPPSKVTCQLFSEKLAIIIEDSITSAEQILINQGNENLAKEIRSHLDDAIQPELKDLIEEVLQVKVSDLLSDATLETGRTGIIIVLESSPKLKNHSSKDKNKK